MAGEVLAFALMRGDLDRVEELSARSYALGESIYASDAFQTYGAQIATLRILQGRAAELQDALAGLVDKLPNVPILGVHVGNGLQRAGRPG